MTKQEVKELVAHFKHELELLEKAAQAGSVYKDFFMLPASDLRTLLAYIESTWVGEK
jgi:hypothetical protein